MKKSWKERCNFRANLKRNYPKFFLVTAILLLYVSVTYAWFGGTSYPYRYAIIENKTYEWPISVNDTGGIGINGSIIWALTKNNSYVYSQTANIGGNYSIANDTLENNWENETANNAVGNGNNPRKVWNASYLWVGHFTDTTTPTDSSQNAQNPASTTSDPSETKGIYGKGVYMDGNDGYLITGLDSGFTGQTIPVENYTYSFWMNETSYSADAYIISWRTTNNKADFEGSNGDYACYHGGVGTSQYHFVSGTWFFVACVWNRSAITLYVNGEYFSSAAAPDITTGTGGISVGMHPGGTANFAGALDEVRFMNFSMNAVQVKNEYYNGLPKNLTRLGAEQANNTAPVTHFSSLTNTTYNNCTNSTNLTFTYYATDDNDATFWFNSYLNNHWYDLLNNTAYPNDTIVTNYTNITTGTYNWTLFAQDASGLQDKQSIIFTVNCTNATTTTTTTTSSTSTTCNNCTTYVEFKMSCDPFWSDLYIIGGFIGAIIVFAVMYVMVQKLPDITRPFIWFMLIIAMAVLMFSGAYPSSCFSQTQINMINILITILIMIAVALGLYSVRG